MDKEFLDKVLACKTAEELRALINGKRQLSVDEMEQVTGGAVRSLGAAQNEFVCLCDALRRVEKDLGKETAVNMALKLYPNAPAIKIYEKHGLDDFYSHIMKQMR